MEVIADLQIHSRFARATSKNITLTKLEEYARIKGITLLGTGDFQHPRWYEEISKELKEDDKGVLWSKTGFPFIWQTEVSLMFSSGGKRRAVHLLIFAPNTKIAQKIISYLSTKGRLDYDGRPIFGLSCELLVKELKEIDDMIEIIPAHCMTPWFGIFGSDSGFDSLKECFGEQTDKIYAIESGMSADPEMLLKLNEGVNIVSFSDAHSFWPWRLGREATIFDLKELSYSNIIKAIRTGEGLASTIETPPEYGKYHFDGHRLCNFSCDPKKTKELKGICPECKKPMTIGVDNRIMQISKNQNDKSRKRERPFSKILPLHEILAFTLNSPMEGKKVWAEYNNLIGLFGNELNILLKLSAKELKDKGVEEKLIELILLGRKGKLTVKPGYDGNYGILTMPKKQATLF